MNSGVGGGSGVPAIDFLLCSPIAVFVAAAGLDDDEAVLDGPSRDDSLGRRSLVEELAFFLDRGANRAKGLEQQGQIPEGFVVHIGGRWGLEKPR